MVVAFKPSTYYTAQFSVVLKEATRVTATVMLNSETQIFFSGHLALSPHIIPLKLKYLPETGSYTMVDWMRMWQLSLREHEFTELCM